MVRPVLLGLALVLTPSPAWAQDGLRVLSRAELQFSWLRAPTADRRFHWLADVAYDLDVLDYGEGRVRLRGSHEAVIGRERRRFDPNQANYAFELAASRRLGAWEIAGAAHHASRHLLDREFPVAISWNAIGGWVAWDEGRGLRVEGDLFRVWDRDFVDYTWTSRVHVEVDRPLASRTTGFARGTGHFVRGTAPEREKGSGIRLEAGVGFKGDAASLELFARHERRLDAFPSERGRARLSGVGFRLVTGR